MVDLKEIEDLCRLLRKSGCHAHWFTPENDSYRDLFKTRMRIIQKRIYAKVEYAHLD